MVPGLPEDKGGGASPLWSRLLNHKGFMMLLLPHSIGQSKAQGQPRFKRVEKWSPSLDEWSSEAKGHRHREVGFTGAVIIMIYHSRLHPKPFAKVFQIALRKTVPIYTATSQHPLGIFIF